MTKVYDKTDTMKRAVQMAIGTARSAHETGHTPVECLEGNRDVFELMFGQEITDAAFDRALEAIFESHS